MSQQYKDKLIAQHETIAWLCNGLKPMIETGKISDNGKKVLEFLFAEKLAQARSLEDELEAMGAIIYSEAETEIVGSTYNLESEQS